MCFVFPDLGKAPCGLSELFTVNVLTAATLHVAAVLPELAPHVKFEILFFGMCVLIEI